MDSRSRQIARRLRAKLAMRGYKIRRFAEVYRFSEATVKAAIDGKRMGPISQTIVAKIQSL